MIVVFPASPEQRAATLEALERAKSQPKEPDLPLEPSGPDVPPVHPRYRLGPLAMRQLARGPQKPKSGKLSEQSLKEAGSVISRFHKHQKVSRAAASRTIRRSDDVADGKEGQVPVRLPLGDHKQLDRARLVPPLTHC